MRKDPTYGDRYAFFSMERSRANTPFEIQLSFHVVRLERRLQTTGDRTSAPAKEVTPYLQLDRPGFDDRAIVEFAREQTQGIIDPLQKARKIRDIMLSMIHCDEVGVGNDCNAALAGPTRLAVGLMRNLYLLTCYAPLVFQRVLRWGFHSLKHRQVARFRAITPG